MLGKLLCFLGLHQLHSSSRFLPSIDADIVTDLFVTPNACAAGRHHSHLVRDGHSKKAKRERFTDL